MSGYSKKPGKKNRDGRFDSKKQKSERRDGKHRGERSEKFSPKASIKDTSKDTSYKGTPNKSVPKDREQKKFRRPQVASLPRFKGDMIFGVHAVREVMLNPDREIYSAYVCDAALEGFAEILNTANGNGLNRPVPLQAGKDQLDKATQGAVHQGVLLDVSYLPEMGVQDLIVLSETREKTVIVMLDQVTDPHNVGAIIRSACAFGINGIVMQRRNSPEVSSVLAKTACGAAEHVPVCYETNLARSIEALKDAGFVVVGLDEHTEATISEIEPADKVLLILGAEGPGMRRLTREKCDYLAKLPVSGEIKSLNVSNAAAVAFYVFRLG